MLFSPAAFAVDREIMSPRPARAETTPDFADRLYRHVVLYGPDCVLETAESFGLSTDDLLKLSKRVNDLIDRAAKPKQDGEPRDVTSYRLRISEAKVHGSHGLWLERLKVKAPEGEIDPRVKLCLDLHAEGAKTSIIASRTGRSSAWVRNTVRASSRRVSNTALSVS